jgi:hypothetical protein
MVSGLARIRVLASGAALGGNVFYALIALVFVYWIAARVDSLNAVARALGIGAVLSFGGAAVCGAVAAARRAGYWARDPQQLRERTSSWIDEDLLLVRPWLKARLVCHYVGILLLLSCAAVALLWPAAGLRR